MGDPVDEFMKDFTSSSPRRTYPGTNTPIRTSAPEAPVEDDEPEEKDWRTMGRDYLMSGERVTLYPIGALALALGKRPVTIRSWESKGWLPKPRLRAPHMQGEGRKRLYTAEQIETIVRIAKEEGVDGPTPINRLVETAFAERVASALEELT